MNPFSLAFHEAFEVATTTGQRSDEARALRADVARDACLAREYPTQQFTSKHPMTPLSKTIPDIQFL
jgi:hypothetical protein